MRAFLILVLAAFTGCAANPEKIESVAASESARLATPERALSTFAAYELRAMVLSPAVQADEGKVIEARKLDQKIQDSVQPLLAQWETKQVEGRSGMLIIEPRLSALRVVSGGARFWAGAFAGESNIDLDLVLTDKETGALIAKPRINLDADAMTGAWSIGASDDNLLDYVAATVQQYLEDNFAP